MTYKVTVLGIAEAVDYLDRLTDFWSLLREPLEEAGEAGAAHERVLLRSHKSREGTAVQYVKPTMTGGEVKYGPRGGRYRAGYLAALFQDTGTGVYGPKGRPYGPSNSQSHRRARSVSAWRKSLSGQGQPHAAAMRFAVEGKTLLRPFVKGMRPHPWYDEAKRQAATELPDVLRQAVLRAVEEARRA